MTKKTKAQLRDEYLADTWQSRIFIRLPPSRGNDASWHVTDDSDTCVAHCFGFAHSVPGGEGLALRIVAALNYCQGIPTAELIEDAPRLQDYE